MKNVTFRRIKKVFAREYDFSLVWKKDHLGLQLVNQSRTSLFRATIRGCHALQRFTQALCCVTASGEEDINRNFQRCAYKIVRALPASYEQEIQIFHLNSKGIKHYISAGKSSIVQQLRIEGISTSSPGSSWLNLSVRTC